MTENNEDKTVMISSSDLEIKEETKPQTNNSSAPKAKLVCTDSSQVENAPSTIEILLDNDREIIIGRDEACSFPINSRKLSRKHARIFAGNGQWGIEDLNSTNGVFVAGKKVPTAWLKHGDEVKFGSVVFEFKLDKPNLSNTPVSVASVAEDPDAVEKTMMFGSLGSSEAFLKAATAAKVEEETIKKEHEAKIDAEKPQGKECPTACALKTIDAFAAKFNLKRQHIMGILGGIVVLFLAFSIPNCKRNAEIKETLSDVKRVTRIVVDSSRSKATAQLFSADYEEDVVKLIETAAKIDLIAKKNPENVNIINAAARITMLQFERDFAKHFQANNMKSMERLIARTKEKIATYMSNIPTKGNHDITELTTIKNLIDSADIVVDFRKFSMRNPLDITAQGKTPDSVEMERLDSLKHKFMEVLRTNNKSLSVDFLVYKSVMDEIDRRDIGLFNEWTSYFANAALLETSFESDDQDNYEIKEGDSGEVNVEKEDDDGTCSIEQMETGEPCI